jgi:uncharacterized OsmC-like protein
MPSELKKVFSANQTGLTRHPEQAVVRFAAASRSLGGLQRQVRIRQFCVDVDEAAALGGEDRAPNPVELALAALATCQEITYRLHAAALGIPLHDVAVALEGDLDLRGLFGVDGTVRPGFKEIRGSVKFDSPAPPEDLNRLKQAVDAHCPVLDLFRNATPVRIEVAQPSPADLAIRLVA